MSLRSDISVRDYFEFWRETTNKICPLIYGMTDQYCIDNQCHQVPSSKADAFACKAFILLLKNPPRTQRALIGSLFKGSWGSVVEDASAEDALYEIYFRSRVVLRSLSRSYAYRCNRIIATMSDSVCAVLTNNVDLDFELQPQVFKDIPHDGLTIAFESPQHWYANPAFGLRGFSFTYCHETESLLLTMMVACRVTEHAIPVQARLMLADSVSKSIELMSTCITTSSNPNVDHLTPTLDPRQIGVLPKLISVILFSISENALTADPKNNDAFTRKRHIKIYKHNRNFTLGQELMCAIAAQETEHKQTHGTKSIHWRRGHFRNQPCGAGLVQIKLVFIKPAIIGLEARRRREDLPSPTVSP